MVTTKDINWVAGFLEGEGCFYFNRNTCRVQVVQKDPWPLIKMQQIVGGKVIRVKGAKERMYYALFIVGKRAVGIMMTVYPLMSPRRQGKIMEHLVRWKAQRLRGECNKKTHCIRGHEFTPENSYSAPNRGNKRECRECIKIHQAKHQAKLKAV